MILVLNISINLDTASFEDMDAHLLAIADHLSALLSATRGNQEEVIEFISSHVRQEVP